MIRAWVGRGGSGKSLAAVRYLWSLYKTGKPIFSNTPLIDLRVRWDSSAEEWFPVDPIHFGLDWVEGYVTELSDIFKLDNCSIFLDELASWLPPAVTQKDIPHDFLRFLSQDRREGVDLIWTHRTYDGVLKQIRDNTCEIVRGTRFGPLIVQTVWDPDTPAERHTRVLIVSPRHYDLYQTHARVGAADGTGYGLGKRRGYKSGDTEGRRLIQLHNWGPLSQNIYVRPPQLACLVRKFGYESLGWTRDVRSIQSKFGGEFIKHIPSRMEGERDLYRCQWYGHATWDHIKEKRG